MNDGAPLGRKITDLDCRRIRAANSSISFASIGRDLAFARGRVVADIAAANLEAFRY